LPQVAQTKAPMMHNVAAMVHMSGRRSLLPAAGAPDISVQDTGA
jgi:hypothetical protein